MLLYIHTTKNGLSSQCNPFQNIHDFPRGALKKAFLKKKKTNNQNNPEEKEQSRRPYRRLHTVQTIIITVACMTADT